MPTIAAPTDSQSITSPKSPMSNAITSVHSNDLLDHCFYQSQSVVRSEDETNNYMGLGDLPKFCEFRTHKEL